MVLIRNNVQKESTYGWYPSQVNIYENPRAKHGYDKECLFRHWQSGLHNTNPDGVASVTPPGFRGSVKSNPRSRSSKASVSRTPVPALMLTGSRPATLPPQYDAPPQFVFEKSRLPSQSEVHIPTPHMNRGYHGWQPQPTIIGVVDPSGPFIAPSPQLDIPQKEECAYIATPQPDVRVQELSASIAKKLPSRPATPAQQMSGCFRAQSASLNRPRVTPTRPIRSAGSRAQVTQVTTSVTPKVNRNAFCNENTQQPQQASPQSRPSPRIFQNPIRPEFQDDEEEELERPSTPINLRTPTPIESEEMTYDSQLDKYGWLAEIPGDPLNLKMITERLPYAVRCKDPEVADNPFKTRVLAGDTFFLNTIPRKPMTYAVHPEWQSENFVTKRKELEKQGRKFHTRNFGFVY